jgi:hypothetical protein
LFQLSDSIAAAEARDATRAAQGLPGSTSASSILVDGLTSQADADAPARRSAATFGAFTLMTSVLAVA